MHLWLTLLAACADPPSDPATSPAPAAPQVAFHARWDQACARSRDCQTLIQAGTGVVQATSVDTFYTVWIPNDYLSRPIRRVLVGLPGTGASAWEPVKDELELARKYGYALVGIQTWDALVPAEEHYLSATDIHRVVDEAVRHVQQTYGATPGQAALVGFSRSSAQIFELAHLDRRGARHFAVYIGVSGGYDPSGPPYSDFWTRIQAGELGADAMAGAPFFLYCGLKDERRGTEHCRNMQAAIDIVTRYGARVERFVQEESGGHLTYFQTPTLHEQGIATFLSLTGGSASPSTASAAPATPAGRPSARSERGAPPSARGGGRPPPAGARPR